MIKQYYNMHAQDMIENTLDVDLKPIYAKFEAYLPRGGKLLDVGFGSGRDSLHFSSQGFEVVSADFAEEVVRRGRMMLHNEVLEVDVREMAYRDEFDAIWASAVLFHFTEDEIVDFFRRAHDALKSGGYLYCSFKYGTDEGMRHGRFFNDFTEAKYLKLLERVAGFESLELWVTWDARPTHAPQQWLNCILKKSVSRNPET